MPPVQGQDACEQATAGKRRSRAQRFGVSSVIGGVLLCGMFAFPQFSQAQGSKPLTSVPPVNNTSVHIYESKTMLATDRASINPLSTQKLEMATVAYSATDYVKIARQAASKVGIDPERFVRQIRQESGFNPRAVSPAGAIGIAQFMPGTAANMGVNPRDPVSSLNGAARLMKQLSQQFGGDYAKALAAYNAGPGAVQRAVRIGGKNWKAYLPAETRHYIAVIM